MTSGGKAAGGVRRFDLTWPIRFDELDRVLDEIWAGQRRHLDEGEDSEGRRGRLVGVSADSRVIESLVERVAPSAATVLITGESGTGKEVLARQIHAHSGRTGEFVAVNCGAIPDHLLESELFGHERGAFTDASSARAGRFELAAGGTLFLDEIGDMPKAMQVKLLRVLQERVVDRVGGGAGIAVDFRLICATHRNLAELIDAGDFREDLYYRISVFPIEIPPLRERPDDIRPLVDEMIRRVRRQHGVSLRLTDAALRLLEAYEWPGNVRELANVVERLAVVKPDGVIDEADIPWPLKPESGGAGAGGGSVEIVGAALALGDVPGTVPLAELPEGGLNLKKYLADIEKRTIQAALDEAGGVVQKAADRLGIGRTTLVEKIRRYGIGQ